MTSTTYEYRTMRLVDLLPLTAASPPPDSYLSDDEASRAYKTLLAAGYRWVRTDQDLAVFERQKHHYPALESR